MTRSNKSFTLLQASQEYPSFARLTELVMDSSARLKAIQPLIPEALRSSVRPGPIESTVWCLVVTTNAAAAKIRQLLPTFCSHLRSKGWDVTDIRIQVQKPPNRHAPGQID